MTRTTDDTTFELPAKRVTGDTVNDVLTENAYNNILPARYLKKDTTGGVQESPEELFRRVAKNIALGDLPYLDATITVYPTDIKQDATQSRRQELCADVFGDEAQLDSRSVSTTLTEHNVYAFSYDAIIPRLDSDIQAHIEDIQQQFFSPSLL